jgi:hypothetical protein
VTIPSQIRYVYYFEHILKGQIPYPLKPPTILICKIKISPIPNFGSKCTPYFTIANEASLFNYKKKNKLVSYKNENFAEFKVNNFTVSGDVKIIFFNDTTFGKDKMCKLWFNTYFVPNDGSLVIKKSMLDKAFKDKDNKEFAANFKVEISSIMLDENYNVLDVDLFKDFQPFKV